MVSRFSSLLNVIRDRLLRWTGFEIKARYVQGPPKDQNAIDLFRGEWASRLPGPYESGRHELFDDSRISWLLAELGSVAGMRVLDCGALEGGHTYMLERAGASVLAVEANTRAFLRALVAKEVLEMKSRFRLGDFIPLLQQGGRYDLVVASGVLYHLLDPVSAIESASRSTTHLYIWTHYYRADKVSSALRFSPPQEHDVSGFRHTLHRQQYHTKVGNRAFFGGAHDSSCWLERDALLDALKYFGFDRIVTHFDNPDTTPGPSIALLASRDNA